MTRLGWSDVALVEANELTSGSTWHAGGLCTQSWWLSSPTTAATSRKPF
ncbi:MAG: hypothetical protein E6G14_05140 [Actinobacteria bacterium]|nr:MAG: hypothetical protein E6G14_05140 [Actinomycetota bacterium]